MCSREHLQDSALLRQIGNAITARLIAWFRDMAAQRPDEYRSFYEEYQYFIKEGVWTDLNNKVRSLEGIVCV